MSTEEDILEVDLGEILYQLIHKLHIIILAGIICAVPVFVFMSLIRTPEYVSTTSISVAGAQATQLTEDYTALATSSEVMEGVIDTLNLDYSAAELAGKITASITTGTKLLSISVTDTHPEMAKTIADAAREKAIVKIRNTMAIENIQVINEANIPQSPAGTSAMKMTVLAAIAGMFIAACVIAVMVIFNNTIKTPEDVETYIGLDTLGIIPLEQDEVNKNANKKRGN